MQRTVVSKINSSNYRDHLCDSGFLRLCYQSSDFLSSSQNHFGHDQKKIFHRLVGPIYPMTKYHFKTSSFRPLAYIKSHLYKVCERVWKIKDPRKIKNEKKRANRVLDEFENVPLTFCFNPINLNSYF